MLYIVPTPIGNLKDITLRAIEVLKSVDLILAEDTRNTIKLLNHYQIICPLTPFHQHNEHQVLQHLTNQLLQGKKMAMVSDAGTPGISDPAFLLVRECIKVGIKVECLPGPTAFVPALVNSGLTSNRFVFEGFLPQKKGRQTRLKELAEENRTIVFYESTYRIEKLLNELNKYLPERYIVVCREITKKFEETWRGFPKDLVESFPEKISKGEFVVVIAPKDWIVK